VLGRINLRLFSLVRHVPTAIILQFVSTFGVWMLAERIGLSAVLTMVCYAVTLAREAPARMPARLRVPTYAVWETVVFAINILAFIFIGLQIRPILDALAPGEIGRYLWLAATVLVTVIVVRIAWVMTLNTVVGWWLRRKGCHPRREKMRPTVASGVIVSWAGMRGIVSLAAALALPAGFPFRDLIVLTAFAVVLGTLVIQGLTLKPLMRALKVRDDDPVGREVIAAREHALKAGLAMLADEDSAAAHPVRHELTVHLVGSTADGGHSPSVALHHELHRRALAAARQAVLDLRTSQAIGDDAFHLIEEELDWLEMASRKNDDG